MKSCQNTRCIQRTVFIKRSRAHLFENFCRELNRNFYLLVERVAISDGIVF